MTEDDLIDEYIRRRLSGEDVRASIGELTKRIVDSVNVTSGNLFMEESFGRHALFSSDTMRRINNRIEDGIRWSF